MGVSWGVCMCLCLSTVMRHIKSLKVLQRQRQTIAQMPRQTASQLARQSDVGVYCQMVIILLIDFATGANWHWLINMRAAVTKPSVTCLYLFYIYFYSSFSLFLSTLVRMTEHYIGVYVCVPVVCGLRLQLRFKWFLFMINHYVPPAGATVGRWRTFAKII